MKSIVIIATLAPTLAVAQPTTLTVNMTAPPNPELTIWGVAYEDLDGDGQYTKNSPDKPLPGIGVSDGDNVVLTADDGKYRLDSTGDTKFVFATIPANFERNRNYYRILTDAETTAGVEHAPIRHDFALKRAAKPDAQKIRFIQTSDIHIGTEADRAPFARAVEEINRLTPAANFIAATGDLINTGNDLKQFEVYTSTSELCKIPWFHVFGNHDANKGDYPTRNYHQFLGPDYYSADYGDLHLVMLNCIHKSERQDHWFDRDMALLGQGKRVMAFQHFPPTEEELARFQKHKIVAVFSGHWHTNKITEHASGLVNINHPTFLMGGIDGSPSSFRIMTVDGAHITSEYRINDFEKQLSIVYPQGELTGPERLLANAYDTTADLREIRFRVVTPESPALAEGNLAKVSPLSWMAPLEKEALGLKRDLPDQFTVRVRVTNQRGEQWEATQQVAKVRRADRAPKVEPGKPWPLFMRSAQRTGAIEETLAPPLSLRWLKPTHGHIDYGSPVYMGGKVAIGVKDRDNLINNGIAILNVEDGEQLHFAKTDSMINHSPAFIEPIHNEPPKLLAQSVGGTVYIIESGSGAIRSKTPLGGKEHTRWGFSSPAIEGSLAVVGTSPMLLGMDAKSGIQRWMSQFGKDWISSYASPSIGDVVVMGAAWLTVDKKPASIYGLDPRTGNVVWRNESRGVSGSVAIHKNRGYALELVGAFKVIDLATGADIFKKELDKGWSFSTPAVDDEVVIVPTATGKVYAFHPDTFEEKWTFTSGEGLWRLAPYDKEAKAVFSSPTIAGAVVYFGCSDGKLYALDKSNGSVLWYYNFGVPTLATPCITGNALITAAYDGNVYCFTTKPEDKKKQAKAGSRN